MNIYIKTRLVFISCFLFFFLNINYSYAGTYVYENITEDTTWATYGSPYIVSGEIAINENVNLNIDSGVVVKFLEDSSMAVFGNLNTTGSLENKVVFTSYYDDEYGGDTDNEEGEGEDIDAYTGAWDSVYVFSGGKINFGIDVLFRYADTGFYSSGGELDVKNILFENNLNGIFLSESIFYGEDINFLNIEEYSLLIQQNTNFNIKKIDIKGSYYPVNVFEDSILKFDEIYITDSKDNAISVFNGSVLEGNILNIKDSQGSGLEVFNHSDLILEDLDILNTQGNQALILFNDALLKAKNIKISGGDYGIIIFNGALLEILNGEISNFLYSGLEDYGSDLDFDLNRIFFEFVEIKNNNQGLAIYSNRSTYVFNKCSIYDNENVGIQAFSDNNFDFTKVWWGSASGPYHESLNIEGEGNIASGDLDFIPFLTVKPSKNKPLIIIPGITGSYLYKDYDDYSEIWPNVNKLVLNLNKDSFLDDLSLNIDASENFNFPIRVGDIIRNPQFESELINYESHIFDYFINYFLENGYKEDVDLFVFPYDWRFSNVDTAKLLNKKIEKVLETTGAEKVDIASHSMGGIVSKTYIRDFGSEKINHLVFMGTPHLGAPKGAKALVYGDDMGLSKAGGKIHILNPDRIKIISQNMPAVYELIPSRKYLSENGGYLNMIDGGILNYSMSTDFLLSKNLNQTLYTNADILHKSIDDINFGDIDVSNISGCGGKTVGRIDIRPEKNIGPFTLKEDFNVRFTDGDTTVPLGSANGVNIKNKYFINGISHGTMPSSGDVPELVYKILKDEDKSDFSVDQNICEEIEGDVLSKHSPVDLHIYDEEGNHAGPDENGNIENNIDGLAYEILDDKAFIFLPKGGNYKIEGDATDSGEFDLALESVKGDDILSTRYWQGININENSQIELSINSGNYGELMIDSDGNDDFEIEVSQFVDLGDESYLEYSYDKFINEHVEENKLTSFGFKKSDTKIEQDEEYILDEIFDVSVSMSKNLSIPGLQNLENKEGLKNSDIVSSSKEDVNNQQDILEDNNLVSQVGRVNIPAKLPIFVFSISILCLITAIVKKYYFEVK